MKWRDVTPDNYQTVLSHRHEDRIIWETLLHLKYKPTTINAAFDTVYRIAPFTRGRNVLELYAGNGIVGCILLRKRFAKHVYQADASKRLTDANCIVAQELAQALHVRHKWTFIWGDCRSTSDLRAMTSFPFSVIVAIGACGMLTDIAISFAIAIRKNIVIAPCCYGTILDANIGYILEIASPSGVDIMRLSRLIDAGYTTRVRIGKGISKTGVNSRILIGTISRHHNRRVQRRLRTRVIQCLNKSSTCDKLKMPCESDDVRNSLLRSGSDDMQNYIYH